MTLRMHPTSASRWAQLAATRHVIDLAAEEATESAGTTRANAKSDRGRRRRQEHAEIQALVDSIASRPEPARS